MRISTAFQHQLAVQRMQDTQSGVAKLENQISSGQRISTPSDDPVGAAQSLDLNHDNNANTQYLRNIDAAHTRLGAETNAITSATNLLQRVNTLVLQANNDSQTPATRKDIAVEVNQRLQQLVQLGNTTDANGGYIFAGTRTQTQPFELASDGSVGYAGDNGQRLAAVAPQTQIASGDSGSSVFLNIPNGNGHFAVAANSGNTGSAVAGASSFTDSSQYDNGQYSIAFTSATAYDVKDSGGATVSSGTYDPSKGGDIQFKGLQVGIAGTPAAGDSFQVGPSGTQDVFSTLGKLVDALNNKQGADLHNTLNRQLESLGQGLDNLASTQAKIGARINTLDQQKSIGGDLAVQYKTQISSIQDVDYASAISQLQLQNQSLQAAQLTFSKVQGTSLFDYLR